MKTRFKFVLISMIPKKEHLTSGQTDMKVNSFFSTLPEVSRSAKNKYEERKKKRTRVLPSHFHVIIKRALSKYNSHYQ